MKKKDKRHTAQPPTRSDAEIEQLVTDNMKLVWFFVVKYERMHPNEQDRLSYAMQGLLDAATNWKPETEVPFGTYASMRINWKYRRMNKDAHRQKRGGGLAQHVSLDFEMENGGQVHETMADPNARMPYEGLAESELSKVIRTHIISLTPPERFVVERRFGVGNFEPHTLEEAAAKMGLTRERVRQIETQGLAHLKALYEGRAFRWDPKKKVDQYGQRAGTAKSTTPRKLTKLSWAQRRARMKTR